MTGRELQISVNAPPEWTTRALCAQTDPDAFYPEIGQPARPAKSVCRGCFVRTQCLEYALARNESFGIWGGLTVNEREALRQELCRMNANSSTGSEYVMTEVSPDDREDVLRYASRITSQPTDPAAVIINAGPLLAWLEDADGRADQRLRLAAMRRADTNAMARHDPGADDVEAFLRRQGLTPAGDDPDAFLAKARTYYAFLTAGSRS